MGKKKGELKWGSAIGYGVLGEALCAYNDETLTHR